jgi:hypothetical protein
LFHDANSIIIKNDCIYSHPIARINFTTYDLQRDQDIIHASGGDKRAILVGWPGSQTIGPWRYALVRGIFYVNIFLKAASTSRRIEFLWVCWLETDRQHSHGPASRRLERLHFIEKSRPEAFGFISPQQVLRGFHLIPAYHYGRTADSKYYPSSLSQDNIPIEDWKYYYLNRYEVIHIVISAYNANRHC